MNSSNLDKRSQEIKNKLIILCRKVPALKKFRTRITTLLDSNLIIDYVATTVEIAKYIEEINEYLCTLREEYACEKNIPDNNETINMPPATAAEIEAITPILREIEASFAKMTYLNYSSFAQKILKLFVTGIFRKAPVLRKFCPGISLIYNYADNVATIVKFTNVISTIKRYINHANKGVFWNQEKY
jgi:hypothetical protein